MENENREYAYQHLIKLSEQQGYVLFDDIMETADTWSLSIQDVDWLSNSITTRGILVYDTVLATAGIDDDDDVDDFAQCDYDAVFNRVIEIDPSLRSFMSDVRNIKPPQNREMDQLKYQVQEGNLYARQRVIEMHLRFAVHIALQRVEEYDCEMADTLQEACVGLIYAVDKYDPDSSGAFDSYASLWILQNVSRTQPSQRPTMYYPVHKKEGYFTMYPILKSNGYLFDQDDLMLLEEARNLIQTRLQCTEYQAQDIINQCLTMKSLEEVYPIVLKNMDFYERHNIYTYRINYEAFYYEDESFEKLERRFLREKIEELISGLKPREQQVIRERFGFDDEEGKTLEEVGISLGVTRERVRQIESKALRKLKPRLAAEGIAL